MNTVNDFISIGEIVREKQNIFDLDKSTLHYWSKIGLIHPVNVVGKMFIFSRKETLERVKKIKLYQKKGLKLNEIKNKLDLQYKTNG